MFHVIFCHGTIGSKIDSPGGMFGSEAATVCFKSRSFPNTKNPPFLLAAGTNAFCLVLYGFSDKHTKIRLFTLKF